MAVTDPLTDPLTKVRYRAARAAKNFGFDVLLFMLALKQPGRARHCQKFYSNQSFMKTTVGWNKLLNQNQVVTLSKPKIYFNLHLLVLMEIYLLESWKNQTWLEIPTCKDKKIIQPTLGSETTQWQQSCWVILGHIFKSATWEVEFPSYLCSDSSGFLQAWLRILTHIQASSR